MLLKRTLISFFFSLPILLILSSCTVNQSPTIIITNAQIAGNIDEKLMPIQQTDTFPSETTKVFCWFEWENAKIGTKIIAHWHFITDDIPILNYELTIPRKNGHGSVSFAMPEGKRLPEGLYKIDLSIGKTILKTLKFTVG